MFDLNNNDISTVLLLIVLGLLIWYLTKPNNEKFTNNINPSSPEALQGPVLSPSQDSTIVPTPTLSSPVNQVPTLLPVTQTQIQPEPIQVNSEPTQLPTQFNTDVNSFQAFDSNYGDVDGADINTAFQPPVQSTNTTVSAVDINKKNVQNYDAKDFLPKEINDQWFDTDFSQAKTNINDEKLINTDRYVIGINTVGQSLKNASYDIRGTIANPKFSVSPWNNSTYEPDYNIKPLC